MNAKREKDARRFAKAMGWTIPDGVRVEFVERYGAPGDEVWHGALPDEDAPLPEHLEFVGRVHEAVGLQTLLVTLALGGSAVTFARTFPAGDDPKRGSAGAQDIDVSWSAMLAAIIAKAGAA